MCILADEGPKGPKQKHFQKIKTKNIMKTQMTREELNFSRLQEIASFYVKPAEAMKVLNKWMALDKEVRKFSVKSLLERQRGLFLKRVANKVKATTDLLEVELDSTPAPRPISGYSLGIAAYQAEMRYHGGRRFSE